MAHIFVNPSLTAVSMYRISKDPTLFAEVIVILEPARVNANGQEL